MIILLFSFNIYAQKIDYRIIDNHNKAKLLMLENLKDIKMYKKKLKNKDLSLMQADKIIEIVKRRLELHNKVYYVLYRETKSAIPTFHLNSQVK